MTRTGRRAYLTAVSTLGAVGLAGCVSILGSERDIARYAGEEYDIGMTRNAFVPDEYEISIGETVVWKNTSGAMHTITAYERALPEGGEFFASGGYATQKEAEEAWDQSLGGGIDRSETFEHTFKAPGSYSYYCIAHEVSGQGVGKQIGIVRVTE